MWSEIAMKSYIQSFYFIEIPYESKSCLNLRDRLLLASCSPKYLKQKQSMEFFFVTKSIIARLRFFLRLFLNWFA